MKDEGLAGRSYARVYRASGRGDLHDFLRVAVERSGGRVLYASGANRSPVYLGIQGPGDERLGVLCYVFRCNPPPIRKRPPDEHRAQVRYGSESTWGEEHPLGRDVADVDVTVVVGAHLQADLYIGLDPGTYDPLPMGISVEFKQATVDAASRSGWEVWERENHPGRRRDARRSPEGLETLVAFRPERFLDYVRFERRATGLGLDPPLRYRAAELAAPEPPIPGRASHTLEREFDLSSREILALIADRARLNVAVRGGVAEHHLGRRLRADPTVVSAELIDRDGEPDFRVRLVDGRSVLVECKNVSPNRYASGEPKVEVQKTRSQRGDAAGRFYRPDQFDVVAACLYPVTGHWEFRFKAAAAMDRHPRHPDRLAVLHRVDDTWSADLSAAITPGA